MNSPDKHLQQRARALYRAASNQLDPALAGRLRAARRAALQAAQAPVRPVHRLLPAGAFAVIALLVAMVWQPLQNSGMAVPKQTIPLREVADTDNELPPDADSADPNLYQNLDFYGWLASNASSRNAGGSAR